MTCENIKLEVCPFCGGHGLIEQEDNSLLPVSTHPLLEETVDGWWRVICYHCGATVSHPDKNTVIARWNNRSPEPQIHRYIPKEKRRQPVEETS